jgi:hypothetical protein
MSSPRRMMMLSRSGWLSRQCAAVRTTFELTRVPVHRKLPRLIATTEGHAPGAVVTPP